MRKTCTKCFAEKELLEYPKNKHAENGRAPQCKVCAAAHKLDYSNYEYSKGYNAGVDSVTRKEQKILEAALRHVLVEQYMEQEEKIVECINSFGDYLHAKCYFGAGDFDARTGKAKAK